MAAGLGGLLVPVAIYLAINAGRPTVHGWGAAMSTDTAFALGMLALTGPRFPDRVRAFLLSVAVVDDLASLVVIGAAYTNAGRVDDAVKAFQASGAADPTKAESYYQLGVSLVGKATTDKSGKVMITLMEPTSLIAGLGDDIPSAAVPVCLGTQCPAGS